MRSVLLLLSVVALSRAAIQPTGPVYRSATVVNSSPVGKSLPQGAEERESLGVEAPSTGVAGNPTGLQPASAAAPANTNTPGQVFRIVYYPTQPATNTPTTAVQSQYMAPAVDFWTKYRGTDAVVAIVSLSLVGLGGTLLYPKLFKSIKARAMRKLAEMNSEDASRMAKDIFGAIERMYEAHNGD